MKSTILAITVLAGLTLSGCGSQPASSPTPQTATTPTSSPASPVAAAPGGGDVAEGLKVYQGTCLACHGEGGVGIMNLGKALVGSPMLSLSDDELVAFIIKGRDGSDPANTTGIAMPPKGGNPALTEKDLKNVVAYMRTLK